MKKMTHCAVFKMDRKLCEVNTTTNVHIIDRTQTLKTHPWTN
jgi:hypothetical protein